MSDIPRSQHQTSASVGKVEFDDHSVPAPTNGSDLALAPGDRSSFSASSSPEAGEDHDHLPDHEHDHPLENPQQQKRKGGRKPIYATSEERKQRNRQAQAAFRERRTEYIKQLESNIKVQEETLQNLQASHRTAADECLMLRYKNSLLERILIEKGIDVQAELQAKTSSPNLVPTRVNQGPPSTPIAASPVSRFAVGKFPNRRSLSALSTKPEGVQRPENGIIHRSPLSRPTTGSHLSSPTGPQAKSPNFGPQGPTLSPSFGPAAPRSQQLRPQQQLRPHFNPPPARPGFAQHPLSSAVSSASGGSTASVLSGSSAGREPQNYYPSPFQTHYEQLEQEYEAQADMMDEQDANEQPSGVSTFPTSSFSAPPLSSAGIPQPQVTANPNIPHGALSGAGAGASYGGHPTNGNMYDPYDPMLDADPFGLSASMHFPTQFSFDAQR